MSSDAPEAPTAYGLGLDSSNEAATLGAHLRAKVGDEQSAETQ
jgi:hypothetical protein